MENSNRELVLVRNLRWLNKEKYSFSVHFIPFFPSTLFLCSKTRIHSASGGQEMLIRSEAFNQGDIYENEGTWGTRLFQCYFGLRGWQLIRDIPYFGGRFKETCTCHWPFFSILRTDYPFERTWENICSSSGYASQVRDFRVQRRERQRECKKKNVLQAKQQLCTCIKLFCTFLCPFLHDYDVLPNLAFYGGRKQATTKFNFSFCAWIWSVGIQLQEGSPTFDKVSG